jgi:hypothetical protein
VGLNRGAVRLRILRRIRELVLEGYNRRRIMQVLDEESPLPDARRWTHDRLHKAVQRLRKGVPGLEPLPAGLLEPPDMAPVRALVKQGRAEGQTWKQIAADLNAAGLRPVQAAQFSLLQVMDLMRNRPGLAPRGKGSAPAPHPRSRP